MAERWNPWRAMRARPELTFVRRRLPAGVKAACVVWPDETVIVIDDTLGPQERNVALAHELVHLERGVGTSQPGMPSTWAAVEAREERIVDRTVAHRLVPLDELDEWAQRRADSDIPTTASDIAEHFGVTEAMAELAALLLKGAA